MSSAKLKKNKKIGEIIESTGKVFASKTKTLDNQAMRCPNQMCKHAKLKVIDTIGWLELVVLRTRRCEKCGFSFSTTETIDQDGDYVDRIRAYESRT